MEENNAEKNRNIIQKALYKANYAVPDHLPKKLQTFQIATCDSVLDKLPLYPETPGSGVRDAARNTKIKR